MSDNIKKVKEFIGKIKNIKKIMALVSALLPTIQIILIILVIIIIIFLPMFFFNSIKDGFYNGIDKTLTFLSTGRWMSSSENVYYTILKEENNRYLTYNFREGDFDIPLLAATSHYANLFGPENFDYVDDDSNLHLNYDEDKKGITIEKDQARDFYIVASNQLGTSRTIIPTRKKLIGHLVDFRIESTCVSITSFFSGDDDGVDPYQLIKDFWNDFWLYTQDIVVDNAIQVIDYFNFPRLIILMHSYKSQGYDYLESKTREYLVTQDEGIINEFLRIIKQSNLGDCKFPSEIPIPKFVRFINYDLYKEYLRNLYLKEYYINCANCKYKDYSDEDKKMVIERMIDEIFSHKKAWDDVVWNKVGYEDVSMVESIYIPGMSSLPVPLRSGGNLVISSGYKTQSRPDHGGIDLPNSIGTPIFSIADGRVIFVGCPASGCAFSYGKYIIVEHDIDGDGKADYYSLYAHLSKFNVSKGDIVGGGQKIGEMGSTGRSTGPHLHFEIQDRNRKTMDPLPILKAIMEGNSVFDNTETTTYYYQGDFKTPYCDGMNINDSPATIANSGSLPSSYAMVAIKLGEKTTPTNVANYICQNTNYKMQQEISVNTFLIDYNTQQQFNIKGIKITDYSIDKVISILKSGKPIIANVQGGHFSLGNSNHYIVLDSIVSDDKIKILDSSNKARSEVPYTKEEVETYVLSNLKDGMWYFEKR